MKFALCSDPSLWFQSHWNKFKTGIIAELTAQLFKEVIQEPFDVLSLQPSVYDFCSHGLKMAALLPGIISTFQAEKNGWRVKGKDIFSLRIFALERDTLLSDIHRYLIGQKSLTEPPLGARVFS